MARAQRSTTSIGLRLALSVVLAAGFVWALRPYLRTIPENLSVEAWVLPAYLLALVPYHLLRAGRWYFLVRPLGDVRWGSTTLVALAGYMWIAVLPFRLGELARPLFLTQHAGVPGRRALGTVAIERVVDGLVICALFFVALAFEGRPPALEQLYAATVGVMAAFGAALLVLVVMAVRPDGAGALVRGTLGRVAPKLAGRVANLVTGVAEGLAALPSLRPLVSFVSITMLYWIVNGLGMWVLARGCDLPLSAVQALVLLAVMNIALLVPGGPAQLGVFQTGVALGLGLFLDATTVKSAGSTFAFYLYVTQLGTIVAAGLWAQRRLHLDWRRVLRIAPTPDASDLAKSKR